jgi:hypothetical protein
MENPNESLSRENVTSNLPLMPVLKSKNSPHPKPSLRQLNGFSNNMIPKYNKYNS